MRSGDETADGGLAARMLRPMIGQAPVYGGCDACEANQTVHEDEMLPGVFHIVVHHDDWCPILAAHEAR